MKIMSDLVELKRQFLEYLEIEQGRSTKTVENYERYLGRFLSFTGVKKPSDLTEEQVQAFRLYLNQQAGTRVDGRVEPMKQLTQNYYLIALRAFLKFLRTRGVKTMSPELIKLTKVPKRQLGVISSKELKRLLSAPDQRSIEGKRDRAILELFFSTGLRISELCGLSIPTIDFTSEEFLVRGKGKKVRTVLFSDGAKNTLREYLEARKDLDDALFIRHGRKVNDGGELRLSSRAVQRLLKKYAAICGITSLVTPHAIRHRFAADLLSNGADLRSVQALLGHAHIGTTQVYIHVTDKHLRDIHKKFHGKN